MIPLHATLLNVKSLLQSQNIDILRIVLCIVTQFVSAYYYAKIRNETNNFFVPPIVAL